MSVRIYSSNFKIKIDKILSKINIVSIKNKYINLINK